MKNKFPSRKQKDKRAAAGHPLTISLAASLTAVLLAVTLLLCGCIWEKNPEKDPNQGKSDDPNPPESPLDPLPGDPDFSNTSDPGHTPRY